MAHAKHHCGWKRVRHPRYDGGHSPATCEIIEGVKHRNNPAPISCPANRTLYSVLIGTRVCGPRTKQDRKSVGHRRTARFNHTNIKTLVTSARSQSRNIGYGGEPSRYHGTDHTRIPPACVLESSCVNRR
jgi:hypothetical protein